MINIVSKFFFDGLGFRVLLKIFSLLNLFNYNSDKQIRTILIKSTLEKFKFEIDTENTKEIRFPTKLYRTWGLYEPLTSIVLKKLIKKDHKILEIGSAYGYFTIQFAKLAHAGKVFAIEPNQNFHDNYLTKNIKLNDQQNVKTFCTALGDGSVINVLGNHVKTSHFKDFFEMNIKENLDFIFIDVDARDLSGEIVRNEIVIMKQIFEFYSNIKKPIIFIESKNLDEIYNQIKKNNYRIIPITRRHFVLKQN